MTTVQVVSDIHLEFLDSDEFHLIIEPSAPILIMAGDIGTHTCQLLPAFLDYVSRSFQKVLWVLGNHEYYAAYTESMDDIAKKLRSMCPANVQILDNDIIHDPALGIVFAGTTLWSHIPYENAAKIQRCVSDFRYINSARGQLITVDDVNRLHNECVSFLHRALNSLDNYVINGKRPKLVMITHHAPLMEGVSASHDDPSIQHAFASDIIMMNAETFGNDNIALWICGHTHHNFKIKHKQFPHFSIISNQFGYEGEHSGLGYRYDHCYQIYDDDDINGK